MLFYVYTDKVKLIKSKKCKVEVSASHLMALPIRFRQ